MRLIHRCYLRIQWLTVRFQLLYKRRKYKSIYQNNYSS